MKNNQYIRQAQYQKGFVNIVLIGVLVLIVAVGGYLTWSKKSNQVAQNTTQNLASQEVNNIETKTPATTTSDETADWKTYTNAQYGFEFKYPKDWELNEKDGTIDLIKYGPKKNLPGSYGDILVQLFIFIPKDTYDFIADIEAQNKDATYENNGIEYEDPEAKKITYSRFFESGFNGVLIPAGKAGGYEYDVVRANRPLGNGKFLSIDWTGKKDLSYEKYLLPILSSLKFTK